MERGNQSGKGSSRKSERREVMKRFCECSHPDCRICAVCDSYEQEITKLRAEEQEPEYWVYDGSDVGNGWGRVSKEEYDAMPEQWRRKFYTRPIPPADVAENGSIVVKQMKRIAELKRKLAEQQAWRKALVDMDNRGESDAFIVECLVIDQTDGSEELNALLAKSREEGYEQGKREAVPKGWQVVPKEPTNEMLLALALLTGWDFMGEDQYCAELEAAVDGYEQMLAAAPKPEEN